MAVFVGSLPWARRVFQVIAASLRFFFSPLAVTQIDVLLFDLERAKNVLIVPLCFSFIWITKFYDTSDGCVICDLFGKKYFHGFFVRGKPVLRPRLALYDFFRYWECLRVIIGSRAIQCILFTSFQQSLTFWERVSKSQSYQKYHSFSSS